MKIHNWDDIEHEQMSPLVARRALHSKRMTMARIYCKKGAVVPRHSHENEQVTHLLEGRMRFQFDDREIVVSAGQIVEIESHEPHRVEALEDSIALDLFQPVRLDWLSGDDAYLRTPSDDS